MTSLARKHQFRELSDQEFEEKMMAVQAELRDWSDRASAVAAFDEVSAEERDETALLSDYRTVFVTAINSSA